MSSNDTPKKQLDRITETCKKAIYSGGEWLGTYMTPQGPVELYVTPRAPRNITQHCHQLRVPPPPKL